MTELDTDYQETIRKLDSLRLGDVGSVAMLVAKPAPGVHEPRESVFVEAGFGFVGDHPLKSHWRGALVPGREVTAISIEVAMLLGFDPLTPGDNLVTSGFDLRSVKPGDRITIGTDVVLERSPARHKPCLLFRERTSVLAFDIARGHNYRGALFTVLAGGRVAVGDPIARASVEREHPAAAGRRVGTAAGPEASEER